MTPRNTDSMPAEEPSATQQSVAADEASPLLGARAESKPSLFTQPVSVVTLAIYVLFLLSLELGMSLPANALTQVVEENICRQIHDRVDTKLCGNDDDVQSKLALLMGWYHTAMLVPGMSCSAWLFLNCEF